MKKIFDIRHIVILIMVGVIIFLQFFVPPQIEIEEKLVYDTIPQEVIYEVEVEVPYEVEVERIVEVPSPLPVVDTTFILKNFYAKYFQQDTIMLNNNQGVIYLFDSISQNKVVSRNFSATIKPKIVDYLIKHRKWMPSVEHWHILSNAMTAYLILKHREYRTA